MITTNQKQIMQMVGMFRKGSTLEEIGRRFGMSRESVSIRTLRNPMFGSVVETLKKENRVARYKKRKPVKKLYKNVCQTCGREKMVDVKLKNRKFCSDECRAPDRKMYLLRKKKGEKEYNRIRCNNYYHEVLKHSPAYKEKVRERNRRALLKKRKQS